MANGITYIIDQDVLEKLSALSMQLGRSDKDAVLAVFTAPAPTPGLKAFNPEG